MHGREHLVTDNLATLLKVRIVYPVTAHLPSLIHVMIEFGEKFLAVCNDLGRHIDRIDLFFNYNIQYHEINLYGEPVRAYLT